MGGSQGLELSLALGNRGTFFSLFAHSVLNPTPTILPSPVLNSGPLYLLFPLPEHPFPSSSSTFSPDCVGSSPHYNSTGTQILANGLASLLSVLFPSVRFR